MAKIIIGKLIKPNNQKPDTILTKSSNELQIVFGFFNVTELDGSPVVDYDNDIFESLAVEKAVYKYVENSRVADREHDKNPIGVLVESMFFSKEKQELFGIDLKGVGWWGGFKIFDKEVWEDVKSGKLNMFSIGGTTKEWQDVS